MTAVPQTDPTIQVLDDHVLMLKTPGVGYRDADPTGRQLITLMEHLPAGACASDELARILDATFVIGTPPQLAAMLQTDAVLEAARAQARPLILGGRAISDKAFDWIARGSTFAAADIAIGIHFDLTGLIGRGHAHPPRLARPVPQTAEDLRILCQAMAACGVPDLDAISRISQDWEIIDDVVAEFLGPIGRHRVGAPSRFDRASMETYESMMAALREARPAPVDPAPGFNLGC